MQNSMIMFTFSVLDRKYSFWANLVQKSKIVSLSWNLVPRLTWICRIQWSFSFLFFFFFFRPEILFLGKFGAKIQDCLLKVIFGTKTNSNMHNSMVVFAIAVLHQKCLFWVYLVENTKIVCLRWNLVPKLIQICKIQL